MIDKEDIENIDLSEIKETAHVLIDEMIDRMFTETEIDPTFIAFKVLGQTIDFDKGSIVPSLFEYHSEVNTFSKTTSLIRYAKYPDLFGYKTRKQIIRSYFDDPELCRIIKDRKFDYDFVTDKLPRLRELDDEGLSSENISRLAYYILFREDVLKNITNFFSLKSENDEAKMVMRNIINYFRQTFKEARINHSVAEDLINEILKTNEHLDRKMVETLIKMYNYYGHIESVNEINLDLFESIMLRVCHVKSIKEIKSVSSEQRERIIQEGEDLGLSYDFMRIQMEHILHQNVLRDNIKRGFIPENRFPSEESTNQNNVDNEEELNLEQMVARGRMIIEENQNNGIMPPPNPYPYEYSIESTIGDPHDDHMETEAIQEAEVPPEPPEGIPDTTDPDTTDIDELMDHIICSSCRVENIESIRYITTTRQIDIYARARTEGIDALLVEARIREINRELRRNHLDY